MTDKEKSIRRYLDAFLEKKWSIIHDPYTESYWIIDVKNREPIVKLTINGYCYYERNFFLDVSTLYDMKLIDVMPFIRDWVSKVLNRDIITIHGSKFSIYNVGNVLVNGVIQ